MLLADHWLGKTLVKEEGTIAPGDPRIPLGGGETLVVQPRFVDAVVAAVKEYTRHSRLFNAAFEHIREEGTRRHSLR